MLRIIKNGFPLIPLDNDIKYLNYLFRIIESLDSDAFIKIDKNNETYHISVLPTNQEIRSELVENIRIAHETIGLEIEFSKSIKISNHISWIVK